MVKKFKVAEERKVKEEKEREKEKEKERGKTSTFIQVQDIYEQDYMHMIPQPIDPNEEKKEEQ